MATISLCMIVKNEEKVLARCLDSVKPAVDEIVILDTGSTDATKDVAARYTDRIYDFPWVDDFSAARNASFAKASMTFTMWLDADDVRCRKIWSVDPAKIPAGHPGCGCDHAALSYGR